MLPERAKLSRDEVLVFIDSFFSFFSSSSWLGRGEADAASAAFTGSLNSIAVAIHESFLTLCQIVCSVHRTISGPILRKDNLSKMLWHEKHVHGPVVCVRVKAEQESAADGWVLHILCISLAYLGLWRQIWAHKLCRSCQNLLNAELNCLSTWSKNWGYVDVCVCMYVCIYIYICCVTPYALPWDRQDESSAWLEWCLPYRCGFYSMCGYASPVSWRSVWGLYKKRGHLMQV